MLFVEAAYKLCVTTVSPQQITAWFRQTVRLIRWHIIRRRFRQHEVSEWKNHSLTWRALLQQCWEQKHHSIHTTRTTPALSPIPPLAGNTWWPHPGAFVCTAASAFDYLHFTIVWQISTPPAPSCLLPWPSTPHFSAVIRGLTSPSLAHSAKQVPQSNMHTMEISSNNDFIRKM